MFNFIEKENIEKNVTIDYIDEVEKKFNIKFPYILRKFYLNHNFADLKECVFRIEGIKDVDFSLDCFIPLEYGTVSFEKEYKYVLEDEYISNEFVPLAVDMDGDNYYWNQKDGMVYYISHENVEYPIIVCKSVDNFFEILNNCCDKIITVPNLNKMNKYADSSMEEYLEENTQKNINNQGSADVEKILKYNGKFVLTWIMIFLIPVVISLLLVSVTDSLSLITAFIFGIWALIFIIIDIINRVKSYKALKRYDINIIKNELAKATKLDGIETYLTDNFIISNSKTIKITKYSDIEWIFAVRPGGSPSQKMLSSIALEIGGTPVFACLNNGKKVPIAVVDNLKNMDLIFNMIYLKNKDVLRGYNKENLKKYKKKHPKYITDNELGWIIILGIFIVFIIYNAFN